MKYYITQVHNKEVILKEANIDSVIVKLMMSKDPMIA